VLTTAGDTLRGQLDYRGERRNSRICRFRTANEAPVTSYKPEDLRGYGLPGGAQYQTIVVPLAKQQSALGLAADSVYEPVFAEALVLGRASLLYLHDQGDATRYFIRVGTGRPRELPAPRQVETTVNGRSETRPSEDFRRVLAASMKDCFAVQPELSKVRRETNSLIKVVRQYNECVGGPAASPVGAERRARVRLALVAGGQRRTLTYSSQQLPFGSSSEVRDLTTTAKPELLLGLGLQANLVGLNRNLSVRIEGLLESQTFRSQQTVATYFSNVTATDEFRTQLTQLQLPVMLRYTYPKGPIRPFIQGGFLVSHFLKVRSEARSKLSTASQFDPWVPFVKEPRRLELGYTAGLGLTTARANGRNVALELRYGRSNGFSDNELLSTNQRRWALLLSYDLTK
jgi:hypothetical protein